MFSCPLHNWYSGEAPCPACERIITSTTDGVIEGTNETDYHQLDKITTLQTQLDELRKENIELKQSVLNGLKNESWQFKEIERLYRLIEIAHDTGYKNYRKLGITLSLNQFKADNNL